MLRSTLFFAFALLLASGPARAGDLGKGDYDVIILGGGKTEADAAKISKLFASKVFLLRVLGGELGGWPQTRSSKSVPGLKPGFELSVLGFCRHSEHDARARRQLLTLVRAAIPEAYVRKVRGAYGDSCPPASLFEPPSEAELALRKRLETSPKDPGALFAYAEYLASDEQVRFSEAQKVLEVLLELAPGHEDGKALSHKLMVLTTD